MCWRLAKVPVLPWIVLFCLSIYFHQRHFDGPTPASRLDLLHAAMVRGTVEISNYHQNTPDKAVFRGHYYSDKAPGAVVLAFPAFAAAAEALKFLGFPLVWSG